LQKLQENTPLDADLGKLAAEVALFSRQAPEQTLDLARQAAAAAPDDYRNQIWLGEVLAALGKPAEAEEAIRRAVALKPDLPEPRVVLVLFLAQTKQKPAAEAAFKEADRRLTTSFPPLLRAVCWEALDDAKQARAQYRAALKAQPGDVSVMRAASTFYARHGETVEAQELLNKLLARGVEDGTTIWARRQLAISLAVTGQYPGFALALVLIDTNLKRPNPALEDQRLRAIVLAMQPAYRRESIAALEQSFARVAPTPEEQFLLAQLYEADGNWSKARGRMLELLGTAGRSNPLYLDWIVTRMVHHREPDEAELWLRALAKLEPKSWRTVQATARLRVLQGDPEEATRLLRSFAADNGHEAPLGAGLLLDELGQHIAAEEVLREYVRTSKHPESVLSLAMHLAKHKKGEEALDLCEKAAATCPPEKVAGVMAGILRLPGTGPKEVARIDRWITTTAAKHPTSVTLMLTLADLRDFQGKFADAQTLYERILEREPKNAIACNNLAVLLALKKKDKEALELSQRALDLEGPAPSLLDTRALAYLATSKNELAVRDLEQAVVLHPTATRYFHLAQAYRGLQDRASADAAWKKAKALGLRSNVLHPLERASYERLSAELDVK
jgi:tetratricopeptide (TPR) repeat protein